jgi:replicative DNA helicase
MISPELLDRLPPHDPKAERAVIGACLLDPRKLAAIAPVLRPDDFYADANQVVFRHLLALDPPDLLLLTNRLRDAGDLERAGGKAYIAELMHSTPVAAHAEHHAEIVARKATFRRLIEAGQDLVQAGYAEDGEPEKAVDMAEATLREAWIGQNTRAAKLATEAIVDVVAAADKAREGAGPAGLMTGLMSYDTTIGGLFPGELIILAARPGLGKTSLACQIAQHTAVRGRRAYFASLEMSAPQLMARVLCGTAGVSSKVLRTGQITNDDADRLVAAANSLGGDNWWIHDAAQLTVGEIRRTARHLQREGLDLRDRRVNRDQQVGEMSGELKELARELEVPVLCLTQLNRQVEAGGPPKLSHLRESGNIEQDADVVVFIERKGEEHHDPREPVETNLCVRKNRNGETGNISVEWVPARTLFRCGEEGW